MDVRGRALIFLLIFAIASSQTADKEIDKLVVYEKIDRVGSVQDGGAEDLEKLITKDVMGSLENDFFASNQWDFSESSSQFIVLRHTDTDV